jgi:hypothetical protein
MLDRLNLIIIRTPRDDPESLTEICDRLMVDRIDLDLSTRE